jgi:hypothetical protein
MSVRAFPAPLLEEFVEVLKSAGKSIFTHACCCLVYGPQFTLIWRN